MKKVFRFTCSLVTLFFLVLILNACGKDNNNDMLTIKSKNDFLSLLENFHDYSYSKNGIEMQPESPQNDSASTTTQRDYSKTNTQVNGVDEADVVKTDGTNIYLIRQNSVIVARAYPETELEVISNIEYENFYPNSLYIDDNYLVVFGSYYSVRENYYYYQSKSRIYIYDKDDYTNPQNIIDIDGYVVTSRKVDNNLLIIADKYIDYYRYKEEDKVELPSYSINDNKTTIDFKDLHYQDKIYPYSFVSVYKFDLTDINNNDSYTYIGSSSNVYVSNNNIYIAQNIYNSSRQGFFDIFRSDEVNHSTIVTKIPYNNSNFENIKSVVVKGFPLNQFSMDEYNNTFRIATTNGYTFNDTSLNNLYIYDDDLTLIGKVEGIAKGESIQSTRFMGERIYIVTFKQVDPFFVIDVKDPKNPKLLGELKIPGYSTYLHPYDENHIIGFGFDTNTYNYEGREITRISGLKMTMFDIEDPTKPKDMFSEILSFGENGYSYSELTYNHKALLFSKSKGIIAFPLTYSSYKQVKDEDGNYTYQYLYRQSYKVYNVSLDGFTYKTDITHFSTDKNEIYRYGYEVLRGLYIENNLYTVSFAKIQVHDLDSYEKINELDLNFNEENYYRYYYGDMFLE